MAWFVEAAKVVAKVVGPIIIGKVGPIVVEKVKKRKKKKRKFF